MKRLLAAIAPIAFLAACAAPVQQTAAPGAQAFYSQAEANLLAQGKMRTDYAPADAPFSYGDLVADFVRIVLYDEYRVANGRFEPSQNPAYLRRWEGPVRVAVLEGASVPAAQQKRDRATVAKYIRRLARLSGLDMRLSPEEGANMLVLFLNEAEQRAFARQLPERYPNVDRAVIDAFANSPRNTFCAAFSFPSKENPAIYDFSLILIKAEHSDLMRKSCIHEELAQALGLTNDSPTARPSIFNDDEEFAFLTMHDEILLKMLYDPRLHAGMTASDIVPMLPEIARDAVRHR